MTNAELAAEFEREAALVDAGEPETLTVFGEVCLNNLPAILSALRIADEAREAGWIINPDGSITRPAYGADFIAALEDGDRIIGEQRKELEAALRRVGELEVALRKHDEETADLPCDSGKALPHICPRCRATPQDGCGPRTMADYRFVKRARDALNGETT